MDSNEMKPVMVDLGDWVQAGQGWNALTYYHKSDDSLLLKLNSQEMPFEETVMEYRLSCAVHRLGVRCPETFSLATDGSRYGILTERFVGKKSFARILYEQPEMLDQLARDMAAEAHALHSLPCDTAMFESLPERFRQEVNSCAWIKGRLKSILNDCADRMRPVSTCLHGDMHPGNILRTAKGDFWIDMGRFGYGDPDMDYASQYLLAHLAPASMVKWILHIDQPTYIRFVESFGRYYYGPEFDTPETQARLKRAVYLLLGSTIAKERVARLVFGSYIRGHEKPTLFLLKLISPLVKGK